MRSTTAMFASGSGAGASFWFLMRVFFRIVMRGRREGRERILYCHDDGNFGGWWALAFRVEDEDEGWDCENTRIMRGMGLGGGYDDTMIHERASAYTL